MTNATHRSHDSFLLLRSQWQWVPLKDAQYSSRWTREIRNPIAPRFGPSRIHPETELIIGIPLADSSSDKNPAFPPFKHEIFNYEKCRPGDGGPRGILAIEISYRKFFPPARFSGWLAAQDSAALKLNRVLSPILPLPPGFIWLQPANNARNCAANILREKCCRNSDSRCLGTQSGYSPLFFRRRWYPRVVESVIKSDSWRSSSVISPFPGIFGDGNGNFRFTVGRFEMVILIVASVIY